MLTRASYSCRTFSATLFFLQVSGWGVQPNGPDPSSSWLLLSLLCYSHGLLLGLKPATGPFSNIANGHVLCEYSRCNCETLPRHTLVIESCGKPDAVFLNVFFLMPLLKNYDLCIARAETDCVILFFSFSSMHAFFRAFSNSLKTYRLAFYFWAKKLGSGLCVFKRTVL